MYIPIEELKKATALTREGKLMEATAAIQRALGASRGPDAYGYAPLPPVPTLHTAEVHEAGEVTDVEFRERTPGRPTAPEAAFESHRFASGGRSYAYRLYLPPRRDDQPLPVLVMLHGCTQDASDFAAGTAMNDLAAQRGFIVVYPEQLARSNSMRCWNWFEPAHQRRGQGEPAMIAALAMQVAQRCNGDPRRIYVAGLSAGGAMATLVGQLYPEVFAAVGVHSGLPAGIARDVQSAQAAMRKPARGASAPAAPGAPVPTIVFHGRSDRTVHPDNGRRIAEEAAARASAAGIVLAREDQRLATGRPATRTVYKDSQGVSRVEHWEIAGAAHAWSGGSAGGTYTDPAGPGASAAMMDFFQSHRLGD
ncbi:PHB depolymerase family esterase [Ramlibacter sp. XY19]|uniref:extracellular catalytic domain type 1 short-chain-length polyhydroxyalkanoate depolymerase n=1 Tax=Ramlibacter paludis TaxID=2908000 RepID=UPI0023DA6F8F|nr:PHB depolymerase family esterase [Ramlibacter paludis]MCG2595814.1 PHB depolymerase family esterase [Ramlibacter paludis]